jgi:putative FmdB family regulatory protein
VPIYEYKCPNGHHFEVFHGMTQEGPQVCEVCGASPLVRVLHPVAVHFKGSGFYSTDYGKGGAAAKRDSASSDGGSSNSGSSDSAGSSSSESTKSSDSSSSSTPSTPPKSADS